MVYYCLDLGSTFFRVASCSRSSLKGLNYYTSDIHMFYQSYRQLPLVVALLSYLDPICLTARAFA